MTKLTIQSITNLQNETSAVDKINANFQAVQAAMDLAFFRNGTTPNSLTAEVDVNSQPLKNLRKAVHVTEPVRLQEFVDAQAGLPGYASSFQAAADTLAAATASILSVTNSALIFETYALAIASSPVSTVQVITTLGYWTKGDGGGATYVRATATPYEMTTTNAAHFRMMAPFNVDAFGAKGDSTTDDLWAINLCRDAIVNRGGGIGYFGNKEYAISDTIGTYTDYVQFEGNSAAYDIFYYPTAGTRIKWIGSAGGIMCYRAPSGGSPRTVKGGGFRFMTLNGNGSAAYGFYFGSCTTFECSDCGVYSVTGSAYYTTATFASGIAYCERGNFQRSIASVSGTAHCFVFTGHPSNPGGASSAFHNFTDTYATWANGIAYYFGGADDCYGINVSGSCFGTGYFAVFSGSSLASPLLGVGNILMGHYGGPSAGIYFAPAGDADPSSFPASGNYLMLTSVDDKPAIAFGTGTQALNVVKVLGCAYNNGPNYETTTVITKAKLLALTASAYPFYTKFVISNPAATKSYETFTDGTNWRYVGDQTIVT